MKAIEGGITSPKGFRASGVHTGVKHRSLDLGLAVSDVPAVAFCAYTSNEVKAAPVRLMMSEDPGTLSAVLVNSGNANALTGERGMDDAVRMRETAALALGLEPGQVGIMSTGVIGRFLEMEKIIPGISEAAGTLCSGPGADDRFARAIMTTDTVKKEHSVETVLADGTRVRISAVSKGSGMIEPSMRALHATTLTLVTTDAVLTRGFYERWQSVLDGTMNMVSVDGDQSTNDTCIMLANGTAGGMCADLDPGFLEGLEAVMRATARSIARDGEGATKLIEVRVEGSASPEEARRLAKRIVNSPLVKTAVFGSDPNHGRIMVALGDSGVGFDLSKVSLHMTGGGACVKLIEDGDPVFHRPEAAGELREAMAADEVGIVMDLGIGEHSAVAWGCDLTYGYVRINAEYTT